MFWLLSPLSSSGARAASPPWDLRCVKYISMLKPVRCRSKALFLFRCLANCRIQRLASPIPLSQTFASPRPSQGPCGSRRLVPRDGLCTQPGHDSIFTSAFGPGARATSLRRNLKPITASFATPSAVFLVAALLHLSCQPRPLASGEAASRFRFALIYLVMRLSHCGSRPAAVG